MTSTLQMLRILFWSEDTGYGKAQVRHFVNLDSLMKGQDNLVSL